MEPSFQKVRVFRQFKMNVLIANKFFFLNGGSERVFFQERDFFMKQGIHIIDFSMEDSRNYSSHYSKYFIQNISKDEKTRKRHEWI